MLFVVSAIEDPPWDPDGAADEVTVSFPWGSLLRGIVRAEPSVLVPLARLARVGAAVRILLSVEQRDVRSGLVPDDVPPIIDRTAAYADAGFILERSASATLATRSRQRSSWAKRLGQQRTVQGIVLRKMRSS